MTPRGASRRAGLGLVEVLVALALWTLFATAVGTLLLAAKDATRAARALEAATATRTALRHEGRTAWADLPACPEGAPPSRLCVRTDVRCDVAAPDGPCDGGALHHVRLEGPDLEPPLDVWRYRP